MPYDLANPEDRKLLAQRIESEIDQYCVQTYSDGHRTHLGSSIMGEPCSRKLWSTFRHLKRETFSGRMLRLFQVGHSAEPRFIQYLTGIGFEVRERDPVTGKQFRISGCNGHYGGSLDGLCKAPAHYGLPQDLIFLNEFKTNNTGVGFTSLLAKGIETEKPKHYKQMCQYGKHYGLRYGLYVIENKNDSSLIVKIVELDWNIGQEMENKANDIISSQIAPQKISLQPSYLDCKICHFQGICHHGEPVEVNCRSCKHAVPVDNAQWKCVRFDNIIPAEFIPQGCSYHLPITQE